MAKIRLPRKEKKRLRLRITAYFGHCGKIHYDEQLIFWNNLFNLIA